MKRTVLPVIAICLAVGCAERPSWMVGEPATSREAKSVITAEFLSEHGFVESEGGPGIYSLLDVRLGDASRDLGFALSDPRPTPSQPAVGSDVRTVKIRNLTFVVRARTREVEGKTMADSLDDPNSICTISVALNQVPPGRSGPRGARYPSHCSSSC